MDVDNDKFPDLPTPEPEPESRKKSALTFGILLIGIVIGLAIGLTLSQIDIINIGGLSATAAGEKTVNYIQNNFLEEGGLTAKLDNVKKEDNFYVVDVSILSGEDVVESTSIYLTKNGKSLFLTGPFDMEEEIYAETEGEAVKSDKPEIQLFVMSFCPFGQQAENGLLPAAKLLGDKIDLQVKYILGVGEDGTYSSLHGPDEGLEDVRQMCIIKYEPSKFWTYIENVNGVIDLSEINEKWKEAAIVAEIDITKIETCVNGEGAELAKADELLAGELGVTGSPTMFINGVRYSGGRSPEEYKAAICAAFNDAPEECAQELSTASGAEGEC